MEVWLEENVYPFSFVGLAKPSKQEIQQATLVYPSDVLVLFAAGGKLGQRGLTLRAAVEVLRTQIRTIPLRVAGNNTVYEVYDALLMDEGYDVFQFAADEGGDRKFKVPIIAHNLPEEIPEPSTVGRDRIKAVLVVAEKMMPAETQEEGSDDQT